MPPARELGTEDDKPQRPELENYWVDEKTGDYKYPAPPQDDIQLCSGCNTMKHLNAKGLCGRCDYWGTPAPPTPSAGETKGGEFETFKASPQLPTPELETMLLRVYMCGADAVTTTHEMVSEYLPQFTQLYNQRFEAAIGPDSEEYQQHRLQVAARRRWYAPTPKQENKQDEM